MGVGNFFGMLPVEMQSSRLYGVELDSVTGRIAKQLYPKANITVAGFETTDRMDFFDLAIGNVPFGQYKVNDPAYNKLGFNIHNYFFAKALDQVRPGGVVAFATSRYTLDAKFYRAPVSCPESGASGRHPTPQHRLQSQCRYRGSVGHYLPAKAGSPYRN